MTTRIVLILIAVLLGTNGVFMLVAPTAWYYGVDGVSATGPLNAHFVRDIGFAYLATGVGALLGAWRAAWIVPGGITALTFLGGHALMHLWEGVAGHAHGLPSLGEVAGVHAPAVLLVLILLAALRRPARQES